MWLLKSAVRGIALGLALLSIPFGMAVVEQRRISRVNDALTELESQLEALEVRARTDESREGEQ